MSTGKIVGYVVAGILFLFGVLFLLSAFSAQASSPGGQLLIGIILVVIGLGIVLLVRMREPKPKQEITIKQQIDVSGDVKAEILKCKQCGGQLDKDAISTVGGAVMVKCPYCGASYQIVEEPKW
jgi:hypothetical protein